MPALGGGTSDDGVPTSATCKCTTLPAGMSLPIVTVSTPLSRLQLAVTDTDLAPTKHDTDGLLVSSDHGFVFSASVSLAAGFLIVHDR